MILLFTDFGLKGPYQGELVMAAQRVCPNQPVVSLFADAPRFNPLAAAHLLAAYLPLSAEGDAIVAVVDPGVGSSQRQPVMLKIDGRWLVGPDNGLFDVVWQRAEKVEAGVITWRPERLSTSFHGRDLFAPVAASLACGQSVESTPLGLGGRERYSAEPLAEIIYVDGFGNAMTGIIARALSAADTVIEVAGMELHHAATFSAVPTGKPFWYENSCGLVELAVNQGSVKELLGLDISTPVSCITRRT